MLDNNFFNKDFLNKISSPGQRLPFINNLLMNQIWSEYNFTNLNQSEYLRKGEEFINKFEDIISVAAPRVYNELVDNNNYDKNLLSFLNDTPSEKAVVIFDGMSIRELPVLVNLAKKTGYKIHEIDYSLSAIPAETIDFIEKKFECGKVSPVNLPQNTILKESKIDAYYYSQVTQIQTIEDSNNSLLLWSSFPDNSFKDHISKTAGLFEIIVQQLETVFQNTVQQIPGNRKIIITSDHGYIFFGSGMSAFRQKYESSHLNNFFGNSRNKKNINNDDPILNHPDVYYYEPKNCTVIRGRVQSRSVGDGATKLYKHGGLSLMECLTPFIVLEKL